MLWALYCYVYSHTTVYRQSRLGKCTYCPLIHKDTSVKCNVSNKIHNLTNLPKHISCELSDIVYLITCRKCNKYYVGETGRAFRSRMYICCKYNTPKPEHRKKSERWWMWNIGAIHPVGINQFV